jgi:phage repressor protein C with HTH and peptisase S24 domain
LPLVHSQHGGEWGEAGSRIELIEVRHEETVGTLPRPAALAGDNRAYAITIVGDSMWPRFRPGRRVAVSPRSPAAIGDDVLVVLGSGTAEEGTDLVLMKELVARTGTFIELRQFNPDKLFKVEASDVRSIHRVLGELF